MDQDKKQILDMILGLNREQKEYLFENFEKIAAQNDEQIVPDVDSPIVEEFDEDYDNEEEENEILSSKDFSSEKEILINSLLTDRVFLALLDEFRMMKFNMAKATTDTEKIKIQRNIKSFIEMKVYSFISKYIENNDKKFLNISRYFDIAEIENLEKFVSDIFATMYNQKYEVETKQIKLMIREPSREIPASEQLPEKTPSEQPFSIPKLEGIGTDVKFMVGDLSIPENVLDKNGKIISEEWAKNPHGIYAGLFSIPLDLEIKNGNVVSVDTSIETGVLDRIIDSFDDEDRFNRVKQLGIDVSDWTIQLLEIMNNSIQEIMGDFLGRDLIRMMTAPTKREKIDENKRIGVLLKNKNMFRKISNDIMGYYLRYKMSDMPEEIFEEIVGAQKKYEKIGLSLSQGLQTEPEELKRLSALAGKNEKEFSDIVSKCLNEGHSIKYLENARKIAENYQIENDMLSFPSAGEKKNVYFCTECGRFVAEMRTSMKSKKFFEDRGYDIVSQEGIQNKVTNDYPTEGKIDVVDPEKQKTFERSLIEDPSLREKFFSDKSLEYVDEDGRMKKDCDGVRCKLIRNYFAPERGGVSTASKFFGFDSRVEIDGQELKLVGGDGNNYLKVHETYSKNISRLIERLKSRNLLTDGVKGSLIGFIEEFAYLTSRTFMPRGVEATERDNTDIYYGDTPVASVRLDPQTGKDVPISRPERISEYIKRLNPAFENLIRSEFEEAGMKDVDDDLVLFMMWRENKKLWLDIPNRRWMEKIYKVNAHQTNKDLQEAPLLGIVDPLVSFPYSEVTGRPEHVACMKSLTSKIKDVVMSVIKKDNKDISKLEMVEIIKEKLALDKKYLVPALEGEKRDPAVELLAANVQQGTEIVMEEILNYYMQYLDIVKSDIERRMGEITKTNPDIKKSDLEKEIFNQIVEEEEIPDKGEGRRRRFDLAVIIKQVVRGFLPSDIGIADVNDPERERKLIEFLRQKDPESINDIGNMTPVPVDRKSISKESAFASGLDDLYKAATLPKSLAISMYNRHKKNPTIRNTRTARQVMATCGLSYWMNHPEDPDLVYESLHDLASNAMSGMLKDRNKIGTLMGSVPNPTEERFGSGSMGEIVLSSISIGEGEKKKFVQWAGADSRILVRSSMGQSSTKHEYKALKEVVKKMLEMDTNVPDLVVSRAIKDPQVRFLLYQNIQKMFSQKTKENEIVGREMAKDFNDFMRLLGYNYSEEIQSQAYVDFISDVRENNVDKDVKQIDIKMKKHEEDALALLNLLESKIENIIERRPKEKEKIKKYIEEAMPKGGSSLNWYRFSQRLPEDPADDIVTHVLITSKFDILLILRNIIISRMPNSSEKMIMPIMRILPIKKFGSEKDIYRFNLENNLFRAIPISRGVKNMLKESGLWRQND